MKIFIAHVHYNRDKYVQEDNLTWILENVFLKTRALKPLHCLVLQRKIFSFILPCYIVNNVYLCFSTFKVHAPFVANLVCLIFLKHIVQKVFFIYKYNVML